MKLFHRAWPPRLGWSRLLLVSLSACAAAPRVSSRPGTPPRTAADRQLLHLVELTAAEDAQTATSTSSRAARSQSLLGRARGLPEAALSVPFRLDRALLVDHLRKTLDPSAPSTAARAAPELGPEIERIRATLERSGIPRITPPRPWTVSSTQSPALIQACEIVFAELGRRWLDDLPISLARRQFRAPRFDAAWARLGCLVLGELGEPEAAELTKADAAPLSVLYRQVAAHRGPEHLPLPTYRVLLGLGTLDLNLAQPALADMGLLPAR